MPLAGVIVLDGSIDPAVSFSKVAGVELITRQVRTLLGGGADSVHVVGGDHDALARFIHSEKRLDPTTIHLHPGPVDRVLQEIGNGQTLLVRGDVLVGPGVVRWAEEAQSATRYATDIPLAAGPADGLSVDAAVASHTPTGRADYAIVIDSAKACRAGKRAIFRNVTKATSGWVSKNLNSKISIPISKAISGLPITPNAVTVINTLVGVISAVFIAGGDYFGTFMGGLLFQLSAAFDRIDGEIARAKYQASKYGAWVDTVGDNVTYTAFVIGLTLGVHARTGQDHFLYLGFGLLATMMLMLLAMYIFLLRHTDSGSLVAVTTSVESNLKGGDKPFAYRMLDRIRFAGKRDFFSLACFALCAADQLLAVFWCAVAVVAGTIIYFGSAMLKTTLTRAAS